MARLVPAVVAMLLHGCHWIVPLSAVPAYDDAGATRRDQNTGPGDASAPIDTTTGDVDLGQPADASGPAADGVMPVDLGCPVSPGVCGSPTDWVMSSGNCGTYDCEKSCDLLTVACQSPVSGGTTICTCWWCSVQQKQTTSYAGTADNALSAALKAGFCLP